MGIARVEDSETADILRDMGAEYLQGFYFGQADLSPVWMNEDSEQGAA